jgi:hypothetical protein
MSVGVRLGKARNEHNESGVPQKAEVVGTLSHFRVGPTPVVSNCSKRLLTHRPDRPRLSAPWLKYITHPLR